jgi:nucleoporin NUP82
MAALENRLASRFGSAVAKSNLFTTARKPIVSLRGSLLCSHGADVFYAVGSSIRCARIGVDNDFHELSTTDIDFEICELVLNKSGSLLAAVGASKVVVYSLPGFYHDDKNNRSRLNVRGREVGKDILRKGKVIKVLWNPIARYDAGLVILTDDYKIRAYDLSQDYYSPEFVQSLRKETPKDTFELNYDEIEDPVSMAFGTAADPYGRMTLYIATAAGDLFALCPFVPQRFLMTKEDVSNVFDSAVVGESESRQQPGSEVHSTEHGRRRSQIAWAAKIVKQMESCDLKESKIMDNNELVEYYVISRPQVRLPLELQGPFVIAPYPDQLYDAQLTDIATVHDGTMTLIGTCYKEGLVSVCLQENGPEPRWELPIPDAPKSAVSTTMLQVIRLQIGELSL